MSKNVESGTGCGDSELQKGSLPPFLYILRFTACVFLLLGGVSRVAHGQPAQTGIEAYAQAVRQSVISQRITAMDQYLSLSPGGRLKVDALEFLVWDHLRLGHQAQSLQRARELRATDSTSPLAIAVLNQDPPSALGKNAIRQRLEMLRSALSDLGHMEKPEGMVDRNFQTLRQQVAVMLKGAMGLTYLQIEDYSDARLFLQDAAENDPNNVQWVYALGLALLNGKDKDTYRGYWYLARATNLTEQTPQGQEIAKYARRSYHADGGKDADWQTFLASAAALNAPPSLAQPKQTDAATVTAATAGKGATRAADNARPAGSAESNRAEANASGRTASPTRGSSGKSKSPSGFEATLREPRTSAPSARSPARPRGLAAPSEAVSLGILIETSLLTNQNRPAIISGLRDIVRNLRSNDEACILVFSDQLDFEQDLTADDQLLEEALAQIRPRSGKALLSGISFAAGHLKRIGKNANRIMMVISDGGSELSQADTLQFRSQVAGVRIDFVGLRATGAMERATLERIAALTGGKVSFASGPEEFRASALEITRSMGIAVP